MRPASVAPAIEQFERSVAHGDERRRADEADFQKRFLMERELGADKTRAAAIQAFFAGNQQPQEAAPAAMPAPVAPPMPAPTVSPSAPAQTAGGVSGPEDQMASAQDVFSGRAAPLPMPTATPATPATVAPKPSLQVAPGGPAVAPSATPAATGATAIRDVQARPAGTPPLAQRKGFEDMMRTLTSNPATSKDAMTLFGENLKTEQQQRALQRQMEHEGLGMFVKALEGNDLALARVMSQRYNLGIPDQVLNSREGMAAIASAAKTAKAIGITDDRAAMRFAQVYLESKGQGMNDQMAAQRAFSEARSAIVPQVSGHYIDETGKPAFYGKGGENIGAPGQPFPKARPTATEFRFQNGMGSGDGKQSSTERIAQRIMDEAEANGTPITYQEAIGLSKRAPNTSAENLRKEALAIAAVRGDPGATRANYEDKIEAERRKLGLPHRASAPSEEGKGGQDRSLGKPAPGGGGYAGPRPWAKTP